MRAVELAIDITSRSAETGFDATSRAASDMASDVAAASRSASTSLGSIGDSADNLDDKAGKATGALGALSAGFELVGAEKYAGALQSAAMATDFASGVGQSLNLVLELESVKRARAVVTSVAHKAATVASSAATKAAAASQWALNAAMSANPVGLIVVALVALVAGFVLAYKKSETFRTIVDGAMRGVQAAIGPVLGAVRSIAEWVGDKLSPLFTPMRKLAVDAFTLMLTPINLVKDAIDWVIQKLGAIKFPSPPKWVTGAWGAVTGGDMIPTPAAAAAPGTAATGPTTVNVTVNVPSGFVGDETALARTIQTVLANYLARTGSPVVGF